MKRDHRDDPCSLPTQADFKSWKCLKPSLLCLHPVSCLGIHAGTVALAYFYTLSNSDFPLFSSYLKGAVLFESQGVCQSTCSWISVRSLQDEVQFLVSLYIVTSEKSSISSMGLSSKLAFSSYKFVSGFLTFQCIWESLGKVVKNVDNGVLASDSLSLQI